jgi:hypothetical protein
MTTKKTLDELKAELLADPAKQADFTNRVRTMLKELGVEDATFNAMDAAHGGEQNLIIVSKSGSSKSETAVIW